MEKHLQDQEAIKKFRKLVNDINICMFITINRAEHEHTRPMATIEVEDDGTMWFFTDIRSVKVEEVTMDKLVHLTYAHPGKDSYMDVWGLANVVTDEQQKKDKWNPIVKAWFPKGPEDPNIALLRVRPTEVYYWDSETGKMVQFLQMAASVITGKRLQDAVEGKISI